MVRLSVTPLLVRQFEDQVEHVKGQIFGSSIYSVALYDLPNAQPNNRIELAKLPNARNLNGQAGAWEIVDLPVPVPTAERGFSLTIAGTKMIAIGNGFAFQNIHHREAGRFRSARSVVFDVIDLEEEEYRTFELKEYHGNAWVQAQISDHSAAYVERLRSIYLFGGLGAGLLLNTVSRMEVPDGLDNIEEVLLQRVNTQGLPPTARKNHGSCLNDVQNKMYVYGGLGENDVVLGDLHVLSIQDANPTRYVWGEMKRGPIPLHSGGLCMVRNHVLVLGGVLNGHEDNEVGFVFRITPGGINDAVLLPGSEFVVEGALPSGTIAMNTYAGPDAISLATWNINDNSFTPYELRLLD